MIKIGEYVKIVEGSKANVGLFGRVIGYDTVYIDRIIILLSDKRIINSFIDQTITVTKDEILIELL